MSVCRFTLVAVTLIDREDDLDDDSYQISEVFAYYGAAMYHAQVLEQGLINALTFAQTATTPDGTQRTFDFNFDSNLGVTMGKLLNRIKPFLNGDTDLIQGLQAALELRNRLAHTFWVEHDKDFMSFAGRYEMLVEVKEAQATFQAIDGRLTPVLSRYLESVGLSREKAATLLEEEIAKRRTEALARDFL